MVGFPYIACLMMNSGLYHPTHGGIWLKGSFGCGRDPMYSDPFPWGPGAVLWNTNVIHPHKWVYGHNATALSLATFYTLLAQRRLVTPSLSDTMRQSLHGAYTCELVYSQGRDSLPDSTQIASKVGLLKKMY